MEQSPRHLPDSLQLYNIGTFYGITILCVSSTLNTSPTRIISHNLSNGETGCDSDSPNALRTLYAYAFHRQNFAISQVIEDQEALTPLSPYSQPSYQLLVE